VGSPLTAQSIYYTSANVLLVESLLTQLLINNLTVSNVSSVVVPYACYIKAKTVMIQNSTFNGSNTDNIVKNYSMVDF
jgi:hypothetical protein